MVTAETAVVLGAVTFVFVCALWLVSVVGMQLRCVDAARDGARAAARGESVAVSEAEALRTAPRGAVAEISLADGRAVVRVSAEAQPPLQLLAGFGSIPVAGRAVVAVEPGFGPDEPSGGNDAELGARAGVTERADRARPRAEIGR